MLSSFPRGVFVLGRQGTVATSKSASRIHTGDSKYPLPASSAGNGRYRIPKSPTYSRLALAPVAFLLAGLHALGPWRSAATCLGATSANDGHPRSGETSPHSPLDLDAIVRHLKMDANITMVAIDFDQTILSIHTGGTWWRDAESILPHVRPQFRALIQELHRQGVNIAIVSFSTQEDVMRVVLQDILQDDEAAARIPVRAFMPWALWEGKQNHLKSLGCEMENILFVDNNKWNVWVALRNGAQAIWFDPQDPDELWEDLANV